MEKRIPEAGALRRLFQEQWRQLLQRVRAMEQAHARQKQQLIQLNQAVEQVVDGTDRRMRRLGRYRRRLRHSTRCLLNYISETINALPAAVPVDRQRLQDDPFLQLLFDSPLQARQLFAAAPKLQEFFHSPAHESPAEAYCLLLFQSTVAQAGLPQQGGRLFRDHRLLAVAASEPLLRSRLKMLLFDNLVAYLRSYMVRLEQGRLAPEERRDLPGAGEGIDDPARYMEVLEWLLSLPQTLLRVQARTLNLQRMEIAAADGDAPGGVPHLGEMRIGDRPPLQAAILRCGRESWEAWQPVRPGGSSRAWREGAVDAS